MLASNPARTLNQITPDLGIPDSVKTRRALASAGVSFSASLGTRSGS